MDRKYVLDPLGSGFWVHLLCVCGVFLSSVGVCSDQVLPVKSMTQVVSLNQAATTQGLPTIMVPAQDMADEARVLIGEEEVIRLRSGAGGLTPRDRALQFQSRLAAFLAAGGNPRDIHPSLEGQAVTIVAGKTLLMTVDAETAEKSQLTPRHLAMEWTNQVRLALGAEALLRRPEWVASRGLVAPTVRLSQVPQRIRAVLRGMASWYGPGFHGRRCANGERFNMHALTAAHRSLPFNTRVKVTNAHTGKSTVVRITDRGPYSHGRLIDLSRGAAERIGMLSSGTAPVTVEVLGN